MSDVFHISLSEENSQFIREMSKGTNLNKHEYASQILDNYLDGDNYE